MGTLHLCQEKWKFLVYHAAGIHEWRGFESFSACEHEALTEEQRQNKVWLPVGSPAHITLKGGRLETKALEGYSPAC